jgi:hypothetical protein
MRLLGMAACGLVGGVGSLAYAQPYVINLSGSTAAQSFLTAPALTNDFFDVDGNGVARVFNTNDQLAPAGLPPSPRNGGNPTGQWWFVQYRGVGSLIGLQELVNYGQAFVTTTPTPITVVSASTAFCNGASQYINAGVAQGVADIGNPGGAPVRADTTTLSANYAAPPTPATGGIRIDVAVEDVPSIWGVQNTSPGTAAPNATPGSPQYGRNPRVSVNPQGGSSGAGLSSFLVNLNGLNLNTSSPDANTIFDTQFVFQAFAVVTNLGTGVQQMTMTDLRYLNTTGRTSTGENLVWVTREPGSGTRNAFNNCTGTDPSWGVGENVGGGAGTTGVTGAATAQLGPNFLPSNKNGSGDLENTVFNHRLAMGYDGAERGVSQSWLTGGKAEIVGVIADLYGGSTAVRPTISNVLHNNPTTGYVIGGQSQLGTIGDPLAAPANKGGNANGNPAMANVEAAAFVNNITLSAAAFNSAPGTTETFFTPGEYLGTHFVPIPTLDYLHSLSNPTSMSPQVPPPSSFLQGYVTAHSALANAAYATFGTATLNGKNPTRQANVTTYSDGVPNGANYITQGGANALYGSPCLDRNRIAGDFNGDGVRDLNDALEMMKAYWSRHGGPAWVAPTGTGSIAGAPGTDAVIEILGDFNGDGNFDMKDIRYWADGLAIDPATGKLDRKKGFEAIDNAWQTLTGSNNFFGTTKASGGPYVAGESRFDVAGSGGVARGWAPVGADGVIDATDVAYVQAQFQGNPFVSDGHANWNNLSEAVGFDLSCDMTGDLVVDQADLDAINAALGISSCYANCDASTVPPILNANDFQCFLNKYAAADPYANCDHSTVDPVLNANDFQCFLNAYAAGCP